MQNQGLSALRKASQLRQGRQTGFTMFEMLIAIVIFVIGLLAIGLLQLRGIAYTRDANMRTTAIYAARTLGDAIKANYGVDYSTSPGLNAATVGSIGAAQTCNVQFVRYSAAANDCPCTRRNADYERFFEITQNLPNPADASKFKLTVTPLTSMVITAQNRQNLAPVSCEAPLGVGYRIEVRWNEGTAAIQNGDQYTYAVVMP
jgi:type IV pilus modification protein PilV